MIVSVVMAIYNGSQFLRQQLQSILEQSFPVNEIVLIDDGSNDSSICIAEEYSASYPTIIKFIKHSKNIGYAKTFFEGIRIASGDIVFLSDQDDIWEKDKVRIMVNEFLADQRLLCLSSLNTIIDSDGNVLKRDSIRFNGYLRPIDVIGQKALRPGMSLAINRRLINILQNYDLTGFLQHDRLIELIAARNNGYRIIGLYLTQYRIHDHNTSGMNLGFTLRDNLHGRICQIEKETNYLNMVERVIELDEYESKYVSRQLNFLNNRKRALEKRNVVFYILWGGIRIFKFHFLRIYFGDVLSLFMNKDE